MHRFVVEGGPPRTSVPTEAVQRRTASTVVLRKGAERNFSREGVSRREN